MLIYLENIYLCGINNNQIFLDAKKSLVVICLKISTFVVSTTTYSYTDTVFTCCDLLENIYLCGINNNSCISQWNTLSLWFAWKYLPLWYQQQLHEHLHACSSVVICLKISTFVVSTTTGALRRASQVCCDLLENIYLCGINNNFSPYHHN